MLLGAIVSFTIFFSFQNTDLSEQTKIFEDYRFYMAVFSEIIGVWLARKNYEVNGTNMVAINFSLFFSLILVPIYAFFLNDLLGFEKTLTINYNSSNEFWLFIGLMTVLTVFFFIDKLKGKINNLLVLVLLPIVLSNSMFITGKLMQEYNGFFAYGSCVTIIAILFLSLSFKNKEIKNLEKKHLKTISIIVGSWVIAIPANTYAVKLLAVEFVTLLKRISQIIVGVILDKMYGNKNNLNLKDKIIIVLMVSLGCYLYYKRG